MVIIDISVEKQAEKAFLERTQYQRALLDSFPFGVWLKDKESAFLAVNTPFAKNYEWSSADALVGKTDFDITSREKAESRQKEDRSVRLGGKPQHTEKIVEIDGEQRCFEIFNSPISIDGQPPGTMGFARDVTDRHLANEDLKENERRYRSFIENIPLGLAITQDGKIRYLNPKGAQLIGYSRDECVDHEFLPFIHETDRPVARQAPDRRPEGDVEPVEYELRVIDKQGRAIELHVHASAVEWEGRMATMAIFEEVTETRHVQMELQRLATTDALTELPNRQHFLERMAEALSRLHRDPDQLATIMVVDIDHLESFNDSLRQAAADAVLSLLSGLLRDELRREDTAGRIGDKELAVLLPGSDIHSAAAFAERLREKIAERTVTIGDQVFSITVSTGISTMNATDSIADQALFRANEALHRAKAAACNRIELATDVAGKVDPSHQGVKA
jgi:diguanylate cyclase (GGDEF)-like protein/PAS domain S-box-containing protein